jgi:hypothetical protein
MKIIITLILLTFSLNTFAQEQNIEIVVTGSRIVDYDEMPAVTIKKDADFLVQEIRLINDSRSPELRRTEIIESINGLLIASKKIEGIELSYGEGFLTPVNLNDESLQLVETRKRVDTNHVDIFVKVALNKTRSSKEQIAELRSFIANAKPVSRTEIEIEGDIGLTILDPEQYRYDILRKINTENSKMKSVVDGSCEIRIWGLESRVMWERSSISELTLYIPYETDLTCK